MLGICIMISRFTLVFSYYLEMANGLLVLCCEVKFYLIIRNFVENVQERQLMGACFASENTGCLGPLTFAHIQSKSCSFLVFVVENVQCLFHQNQNVLSSRFCVCRIKPARNWCHDWSCGCLSINMGKS